jgi:membrane protein DedA with SNARE-associated domain
MTAADPAATAGSQPAAGPRPGEAGHLELPAPPEQSGQPEQPETAAAAAGQAEAAGPQIPDWRPWSGKARARDVICLTVIMLSGFYGLAMIPLTPRLISTHPLLLELLAGSNSSTVAAGAFAAVKSTVELSFVVLAALLGMMKFDLFFWWAGNMWGHRIVQLFAGRSRRAARFAQRAERVSPRWAGVAVLLAAFLPVPSPLVYAVAGWVGLPLLWFVVCDVIGTAAWASLLATLGYILGDDGVRAANLVSRYALITIVVLVVLAVVPHAWHVIRAQSAAQSAAQPPGDGQPAPQPADLIAAVQPQVQARVRPDSLP